MKKSINKAIFAAALIAAGLSVQVANATSPQLVKIESQGNMKFLVVSENRSDFIVKIFNNENELIHQETVGTRKLFNLANLIDGQYKLEVYDSRKNLISQKSFQIKTETKRDVIAQN